MNKKKLRTEGCKPAAPASIFRRWCVTAIILCFTMSATAQTGGSNSIGVINGLDELTGKTFDELYKIAKETNKPSYSMDDASKVFFLYNVETKQFLNSGGYWGTHVSLKHYGLPLWVDKIEDTSSGGSTTYYNDRINFAQKLKTGQGPYIAWTKASNNESTGCFIDRNKGEATGWYFEPTNDGKNTYKIYTKPNSDSNNQYYLHGNPDPFADKRCEADKVDNNELVLKYGQWRVFSLEQLHEIQENNMQDMTESLELSFKLTCPSFSRGDLNIENWKTDVWTGGESKVRFGLEHLYNKTNKLELNGGEMRFNEDHVDKIEGGYTFPGVTNNIKKNTDYQLYLGKYFCADAKNTRGRIYQDIKVNNNGTYVIECKAYSNTTKAKLFAEVVDKDGKVIENTLHTTVLWQISNMSEEQKTALHIKEQNMDYAGRNFYTSSQYTNSVLVLVSKESLDKGAKIRFGIQIGDNNTDTQITADAKEWTVFDDFRLLYAAKGTDTDLILDEDARDLSYLKDCSNTYQNAVLHLNKSFQTDKWTSIILPVNLTRKQIREAFGANSRLAKLSTIKGTEIRFTTINMDKMADENIALEAYKPYILYSTEVNKTNPAYQATLTVTNGTNETRNVRIKANHISIPNVTLKTTADNKNDLSQMDENWLTKASYDDATSQLTIYGTFARTFAPNSKQDETTYVWDFSNKEDKGKIITGRPNLIGCYFLDKGKMWYSASRPRGLRGFSCWIAPKNHGAATPANAKLFLDGIDMTGTTDIEDIFGGKEGKKVEKFADGIYNINGQLVRANSDSTEGLPEGLYIINGKKRFVKQQ